MKTTAFSPSSKENDEAIINLKEEATLQVFNLFYNFQGVV